MITSFDCDVEIAKLMVLLEEWKELKKAFSLQEGVMRSISPMTPKPVQSVEFDVIPKLKEGETLVMKIDVGNLPQHLAEKYVEQIKESFSKVHRQVGVAYFFVPSRRF